MRTLRNYQGSKMVQPPCKWVWKFLEILMYTYLMLNNPILFILLCSMSGLWKSKLVLILSKIFFLQKSIYSYCSITIIYISLYDTSVHLGHKKWTNKKNKLYSYTCMSMHTMHGMNDAGELLDTLLAYV
jgi:hypothetical protein